MSETTNGQRPIGSGFGEKSTAIDVLGGRDLSGKVVIVTGGYAGLGLETTRVLAGAGATVIVPARSHDKARRNLAGMANVELAELDLLDPASIDAFAEGFLASGRPLHILVSNAGIMAPPLMRDSRGYEAQFAGNHLGHFQLTARLWPALKKANGARVVSVSSRGYQFSEINVDDPNFDHRAYDKWLAYGQACTAKILFAVALNRRGKAYDIQAFSVHPGMIPTELSKYLSDEELAGFGIQRRPEGGFLVGEDFGTRPGAKTIPQGAATTVWCATHPDLDDEGGQYCEDCDIAAISTEGLFLPGIRPWAIDDAIVERLWAMSERLCGLAFAT
jgi:NAD(P)-dependent dehydrogenase (short-subunit alcohol dehydrogenase family)